MSIHRCYFFLRGDCSSSFFDNVYGVSSLFDGPFLEKTVGALIIGPYFAVKPPSTVKINLDLLEPCSKKEPQATIKRKGMETIAKLSKPDLATAYTDGSSNSECDRGGSGIFLSLSSPSRSNIPQTLGCSRKNRFQLH
ncbi:unnamed protein product [Larinioides sclopetarius]|uniref:Uncharacterized protein n=1 Tax=Larinioides sclopetarius TaxID=280406 RepID=A0AAV2A1X3_9ARAC